jgi:hypothetical protein
MKVINEYGFPVIEATSEELVKLATAATGAVTHQEAMAFHNAKPIIGFRCVEKNEPIPVKNEW